MNIVLVVTSSISCNLFFKIYKQLSCENDVRVIFSENSMSFLKQDLMGAFNLFGVHSEKHQGEFYNLIAEQKVEYKFPLLLSYLYSCQKNENVNFIQLEYIKYKQTKIVEHIDLTNWADKVLIAPCTMNTLNKLSYGVADNFITSFLNAFLGTSKPCYISLAMNTNMYNNNKTQRSIDDLKRRCFFIQPTVKELACGDLGIGALAYIGSIVNITNGYKWKTPIKSKDFMNSNGFYSYYKISDYMPKYNEPGSFGFKRKHEIHNGVDIYCQDGSNVYAVQDGIVVDIKPFTGKQNNTPWWNDTWAICIKGKSGVVCYGEMEEQFNFKIGDEVKANECIGKIKAVLPITKKRNDIRNHNNAMLHIQLFKDYENDEQLADWYPNQERNKFLLDPTPYLYNIDSNILNIDNCFPPQMKTLFSNALY